MSGPVLPRFPIFVPTKGRTKPTEAQTITMLLKDGVPFRATVQRSEWDAYASWVGEENMLMVPDELVGSPTQLIDTRTWIMELSIKEGAAWHWQLDDNMRRVIRQYKGYRFDCDPGPAFAVVEDLADRYKNVAIAGMNYSMFGVHNKEPLTLNAHVYSCTLVNNAIPHRWRLAYNEDTDICLQVLADGWCTMLVNAFLIDKKWTMQVQGGNTPRYQGDGRLKMARQLARVWPGVVEVDRRFGRPQHVVKHSWKRFDNKPILRDDFDPTAPPRDYGFKLKVYREPRSEKIRRIVDEAIADGHPTV